MARNTTQNQTTYIPKFAYPFAQKSKEIYKKNLDALSEGNYLFTKMGFWHGGIHFQGNALTGLKIEEGIKCIADGELVAYRLDENYHGEGRGKYSTSFFLVRHKLEYPKDNKLIFFSLYMHTAKKDEYNIIQNNSNQTNQSNTNYYTIKKGDTLGQIARIYHTTVDKLRQDNNIADVNKIKEGNVLIIKPFPSSQPTQNTQPSQSTQSNPSNPNFLVENPKFDEVVILSTPKPISAGETLGLMGEYNVKEDTKDKCLHLEVFANKDFKTFVQNAKRGDKNLPQSFSWATIIEESSHDHISIFENLEVIFQNNPSEDLKMNGMFKELFNIIDKDIQGQPGHGSLEPQELVDATVNPVIKDITNKYIVKHSSEWDDKVNMVDVLLKIVNKIDSSEFENKEEYKKMLGIEAKRIINLSFFTQCKNIEGFPKDDKVYVMNVVGLVNEFSNKCISLEEAKRIAIQVTMKYEGGGFSALTGNDDGMGMSWGIIQWNFGQRTLAPLLKKMKQKNIQKFNNCFSNQNDLDSLNIVLDDTKEKQMDWAIDMQNNHNQRWKNIFNNLASVPEFQEIQMQSADYYFNKAKVIISWMRQQKPDLMTKIELVTFVALVDLAVQQETIDKAKINIINKIQSENPTTQLEFLKIVVIERGAKATDIHRADAISRRMGIINRQKTEITHSGKTATRDNSNFNLIKEGFICDL